jgi:YbbR domain-containing protein
MSGNGETVFSRIWMIFVAVFLALAVWFVVSAPRRESVSERAFAAPLSLVGMPRDLIITTPVPDTVSVRLRGRVSDLRSLSSKNLEVTVELSWAQPGEAVITLRPQAINIPPEIEVVSIDPTKIRFRVDQLRQKSVPIRAFLVGQPPPGYTVGEPRADPSHALISGPLSQVRNVTEVATERIIMTGRTDTFVQNAAVVSDSSLVRVLEPLTTQVTIPVTATIGPMPPAGTATTGTTATTDTTSTTKALKP